jgi:hypothetical protein
MNIGDNFEEAEPLCCSQGQSGRTQRPRPPCLLFAETLDPDKCFVCTITNHSGAAKFSNSTTEKDNHRDPRKVDFWLGDKAAGMVLFGALNTPFLLWV